MILVLTNIETTLDKHNGRQKWGLVFRQHPHDPCEDKLSQGALVIHTYDDPSELSLSQCVDLSFNKCDEPGTGSVNAPTESVRSQAARVDDQVE